MLIQKININDTSQRLSYYYTGYRLLLALSLFFILLITEHYFLIHHTYPYLYVVIGGIYIGVCLVNFLTLKFFPIGLQKQNFVYLLIDVIYLTAVLFLSSGPNIAIILMYMVIVLASTLLLTTQPAFVITLLSIIAVIYQQFFMSIFDWDSNNFYGTSSLITLVFLSTYALGQLTSRRFQFIENIAYDQQTAFLELQQINQTIIEHLETGFMVIDAQGKIVSFNDSARTLLQLSVSSLNQNESFLEKVYPELSLDLNIQSKQQLKGLFHFFPNTNFSEGLSIQYRPIATYQQQFTLLIIESLQKINQQVQQLKLASLGQLSASIAHEIRNPLAAISQANDLLEGDIDEDLQILTQMIRKQCKRINHTIEETLSMSKQNQTLAEDILLYKWLKEFIREDLVDIQRFLRLVIEDGLYIRFDPHQLRLVMTNLIRNAVRHGHEITPESKIEIRAHRKGEYICLDVIDQGNGVPESQRNNLFEPFFSTSTNGTGLGLYLAKTFCEANHARLKYIPQTQGACFRIECLPAENQ